MLVVDLVADSLCCVHRSCVPQHYSPPSDFLKSMIAGDVTLGDTEFGRDNLSSLIKLTSDAEVANRDWATFLLAQLESVDPRVRDALVRATHDAEEIVRSEAIHGLALIDPKAALPILLEELKQEFVSRPTFEAAAILADPSLLEDLLCFTEPSNDTSMDEAVAAAIEACSQSKFE